LRLCVFLSAPATIDFQLLFFHQLTNCFFPNSHVFKSFCVALCFFQIPTQKGKSKMTQSSSKPSFINSSARCTHRFPNGRRCRLYATAVNPNFCPAHASVPANQPNPAEIASTLTANLDDFSSAVQINDFLSRLLLLLAQDKISTRRAAVLTYITNQLLRTLPAIDKEEHRDETTIIFDMPGPDRDQPAQDQNPATHRRAE
jgi:hypothetical protein